MCEFEYSFKIRNSGTEFYLQEQLVLPGDETSGAVEMSIIYYNTRSRANLGTVIDILTLGIGAFRGIGKTKVLESLYNMNYSKRNQHQKALKKALADLNEKIMADPQLQKLTLPAPVPEP